jgi:hypothetical protein
MTDASWGKLSVGEEGRYEIDSCQGAGGAANHFDEVRSGPISGTSFDPFQVRVETTAERFCDQVPWIDMKIGSWVIIAVLLAILLATISPGYEGWTMGRDYIAMALGLFFSMVIGIGLMTLVFYSSAATPEKHYALC